LGFASVPNLRELGGWATRDGGTVRHGLVYRSTDLSRLAGEDVPAFSALGIRAVYDLRRAAEREAQPDRLPDGIRRVELDVLADLAEVPGSLVDLVEDQARAREVLGDGRAASLLEGAYRDIIRLPSALEAYGRLYTGLLDPAGRPALIHCTTGKDRTGWAIAALLLLVGVPRESVMEEYLLTNVALLPALAPVFDRFAAAGGDPELLRPLLGVRREYLGAALDEMRSRYETIEGYFANGLDIDAAGQADLRDLLVGPGP
jgi:protein-tyrosine phosphatase